MDPLAIVKIFVPLAFLVICTAWGKTVQAQDLGAQSLTVPCKGAYSATQWSTSKTVMPDGTEKVITAQSDLAQSSSGQMRTVAHAWSDGSERKAQPITRIMILDWPNHTFIMLFPDSHIASTAPLPALASTGQIPVPKILTTDLGTRKIDGISVTGERTVYTAVEPNVTDGSPHKVTRTSETWSEKKLCLTMEVTAHDSDRGSSESIMTDVRLAEPAAALFKIPPNYTLKNH